MGGGSGSGRSSLGNIEELEKKAKKELDKAARRNTFLSFDYNDIEQVNMLRAQSKNEKSEIEFIDRSVKDPFDSERADYIKRKILERIKQCSQTVVYIGDTTHTSRWVKWEVEQSIVLGKKVIAVHAGDKAPSHLPSCIKDNRITIVPWKSLSKNI